LTGRQTVEKMQKFRSFGGVQSYPSRTKDTADVVRIISISISTKFVMVWY